VLVKVDCRRVRRGVFQRSFSIHVDGIDRVWVGVETFMPKYTLLTLPKLKALV